MNAKQREILTRHLLNLALNWRHMVASPVQEIRDQGREQVTAIADNIWNFCQGLGDGGSIYISAADLAGETMEAGTLAAYLAKALVWAERGRFLSFTTRFKRDKEQRRLLGVQIGDHLYSVDYLHGLLNAGGNPADVDPDQAITPPADREVRHVRGRNKCVLYSFHTPSREGREYTITAQKNSGTVDEDPSKRQDPQERLDQDERSQVVTLSCPQRRGEDRKARQETAETFCRLGSILHWLGETPTKSEKKDAVYEEKNGDGCRRLNSAAITSVTLGGVHLNWDVA